MRYVHIFDLLELEKSFLLFEDLLDKVLVDHFLGRHVELQVLREVLEEVSFGSELADQLCDHDSPLLCAFEILRRTLGRHKIKIKLIIVTII